MIVIDAAAERSGSDRIGSQPDPFRHPLGVPTRRRSQITRPLFVEQQAQCSEAHSARPTYEESPTPTGSRARLTMSE